MKNKLNVINVLLSASLFIVPGHFVYAQQNSIVTGQLHVYYLDVGQADAIYITCPTGEHSMLIDAADTRYPRSSENFKKELQKLTNGLKKKIDVVVASHNHADHIGNMKWVLDNYSVAKY